MVQSFDRTSLFNWVGLTSVYGVINDPVRGIYLLISSFTFGDAKLFMIDLQCLYDTHHRLGYYE